MDATYESNHGATPQWTSEWRPSYGVACEEVGVEMTVGGPEAKPLSATSKGAADDESCIKCSWAPRGNIESSVGDVLMRASVERTFAL